MTSTITKPLLGQDEGAFKWRGCHLDVARHFFPLSDIRKFVDALAYLKLNVLHLHLTDDQGWRFESKLWPKLTTIASQRADTVVGHPANRDDENLHPVNYLNKTDGTPHGGFYTQEELRELVAYATTKGVSIVPEVDMPGHMVAARAAYPELGWNGIVLKVGNGWGVYPEVLRVDEPGLKFCRDILGEICDVFDAPYVHIGGDECPKVEWDNAPSAHKLVKDLGLANFDELQRWFTQQMGDFLATRGRRLVGWDEIIDGGVPAGDPVVMAWRDWIKPGAAPRATKLGATVVQAPGSVLYFDKAQTDAKDEPLNIGGLTTIEHVYAYDPYTDIEDKDRHLVIGLQAQLWTEYIPTTEQLWYMAFPRLIALADVAYHGDKRPSYEEFLKGLPARIEELHKIGVGSHPL